MRGRQLFLSALTALLCVAAAVAIVALITDDPDSAGRAAGTSVAFLGYGLLGLAGISVAKKPLFVVLGAATVVASAAAFGLLMPVIWSDDTGEGTGKVAGISFICAIALGYASLLIARARAWEGRVVRTIRSASLLVNMALAVMLVIAILSEVEDETYYRWAGALTVLWTLGTMLVPAVRAMLHPGRQAAES